MLYLFLVIVQTFGCSQCVYGDKYYSCGAVFNDRICCDRIWKQCHFGENSRQCTCRYSGNQDIVFNEKDQTCDLDNDYFVETKIKGSIYVNKNSINDTDLKLDGFVFLSGTELKDKKLFNYDNYHDECCGTIIVGLFPFRQINICCGSKCSC